MNHHDNSTCPLTPEQVAAQVGVEPTNTAASRFYRRAASFWFTRLLAFFQLLDPISIPNSFVNLQCMWWKAISGNDKRSSLCDYGLAYDLLPPISRWIVAPPLVPLYPRFHHANVELRTKYLDNVMDILVQQVQAQQGRKKLCLVSLGCGYDVRSLRMALRYSSNNNNNNDTLLLDFVEMDLPQVLQAKQNLLQKRLVKRRPNLTTLVNRVRMVDVDLTNMTQVTEALNVALSMYQDSDTSTSWTIVFVIEAVLIYLPHDIQTQLLSTLSQALVQRQIRHGALCFADTLPNIVANSSMAEAKQELEQHGWDLQGWIPKPGRTRHLGWATLSNQQRTR